jgi:hypothetical protein
MGYRFKAVCAVDISSVAKKWSASIQSRSSRSSVLSGLFMSLLFTATGCQIPLVIYPAPEAGSGMRLQLQDEVGRPVHADGLMVVNRVYSNIPIFTGVSASPENQVVEVRDGVVQLPHKWALASVYIWWFYTVPVPAIFPGENLYLFPIVPGYHVPRSEGFKDYCLRQYKDIQDGVLTVARNESDPDTAYFYLNGYVLREVVPETDEPPEEEGSYVMLPDKEYTRVMQSIQRELQHLKRLYGELPRSRPAGSEERLERWRVE